MESHVYNEGIPMPASWGCVKIEKVALVSQHIAWQVGRLTDFFNAHLTEAGTAYKTGGSFSPIKLHLVQLPCLAPQTFRSRQI